MDTLEIGDIIVHTRPETWWCETCEDDHDVNKGATAEISEVVGSYISFRLRDGHIIEDVDANTSSIKRI